MLIGTQDHLERAVLRHLEAPVVDVGQHRLGRRTEPPVLGSAVNGERDVALVSLHPVDAIRAIASDSREVIDGVRVVAIRAIASDSREVIDGVRVVAHELPPGPGCRP
jgi:hypothetical protein